MAHSEATTLRTGSYETLLKRGGKSHKHAILFGLESGTVGSFSPESV